MVAFDEFMVTVLYFIYTLKHMHTHIMGYDLGMYVLGFF